MTRKWCWSILAVLCCSTWSFAQEEAPPPPPGDEPRDARPEDQPPPPGDEGSPSDQRPELNDRTTRGYAGQAPGKQAPMQQGPYQAPGKQAPMQQGPQQAPGKEAPMHQGPQQAPGKEGPMQAPGKGTAFYGDQTHTMGYAANYNCAGCAPGYQQQTYYAPQRTARRGLFGRRWR